MNRLEPIGFRPAAVMFDMDGLMIESERALLQCWRVASAELELHLDDALWMSMIGLHDKACHDLLRVRLDEAQIEALLSRCHALYDEQVLAGLPVKAGVLDLLSLLDARGIPRAVATSTRRPRALQKLELCGLLPHFHAVLTGSDVAHPKPAPDIYLLAARELGVDPVRCVVLEDSAPGVRAALAAGMTPIQVPDLAMPTDSVRALGHRIVESLAQARLLIEPALA
ncbi:HAD family hydrolase [Lysobacter niastensis]|uniref:HAD family phosphatase n=1 Tax=Lysobacter niastensis TaxID=380629 RepID=A0ABS0B557_9GAMM|nr:HAD family phosphatase [Lysobacter niastensis]MBF6023915.1 HAD family phosphatase [Lysobacter niastensis]